MLGFEGLLATCDVSLSLTTPQDDYLSTEPDDVFPLAHEPEQSYRPVSAVSELTTF